MQIIFIWYTYFSSTHLNLILYYCIFNVFCTTCFCWCQTEARQKQHYLDKIDILELGYLLLLLLILDKLFWSLYLESVGPQI